MARLGGPAVPGGGDGKRYVGYGTARQGGKWATGQPGRAESGLRDEHVCGLGTGM